MKVFNSQRELFIVFGTALILQVCKTAAALAILLRYCVPLCRTLGCFRSTICFQTADGLLAAIGNRHLGDEWINENDDWMWYSGWAELQQRHNCVFFTVVSPPQLVCVCMCARSLCASVSVCDKEKSPHCQRLENATCCMCILILCNPLSACRHLERVCNLKVTRPQTGNTEPSQPHRQLLITLRLISYCQTLWEQVTKKGWKPNLIHLRSQCCGLKPLTGKTFHQHMQGAKKISGCYFLSQCSSGNTLCLRCVINCHIVHSSPMRGQTPDETELLIQYSCSCGQSSSLMVDARELDLHTTACAALKYTNRKDLGIVWACKLTGQNVWFLCVC